MQLIQGGTTATKTGKLLETQIKHILLSLSYQEQQKKLVKDSIDQNKPLNSLGKMWFTEQLAIDTNLYGNLYKADFFLYHEINYPTGLQIESKYQDVGGSVDEKFPFIVKTLQNLSTPTIIIFDGGGARQCAINWAIEQECKQMLVFVGVNDFAAYARKQLK